jgi:hypothetical protein
MHKEKRKMKLQKCVHEEKAQQGKWEKKRKRLEK